MYTKIKVTRILILLSLITIGIFSCKKDKTTTTTTTTTNTSNLNSVFSALKPPSQTFTVTAGQYATVVGLQGTRLVFYPNSFKNASGTTITAGTIQIELIEMYKPGAMIANRATTLSNGTPLISGGQVYVKATSNGSEVSAGKYGIGFKQPAASTAPMNLYYGNRNNADSVVTWGATPALAITLNTTTLIIDSMNNNGTGNYYLFDSCTSFNYINCDYYYSYTGAKTTVYGVMPDTSFNNTNTQVFIVIPSINSCTFLQQYNTTAPGTFSLFYDIPVGLNIHIVGLCNKNGTYYYSEYKNVTTTLNYSQTMTFTQKSIADIATSLSNL